MKFIYLIVILFLVACSHTQNSPSETPLIQDHILETPSTQNTEPETPSTQNTEPEISSPQSTESETSSTQSTESEATPIQKSAIDMDEFLLDYTSVNVFPDFGGFTFETESWWVESIQRTRWMIIIRPIGITEDELITGSLLSVDADEKDMKMREFLFELGIEIMDEIARQGDHVNSVHWQ